MQNPFDQQLEKPRKWRAAALFFAGTLAIWGAYFVWRPPAPMLFTPRIEHLENRRVVSLTIDDSPHPLSTPLLLAALEKCDVPASFFSIGEGLRLYPELAHRIVKEGHALENHSGPHHNLTTVDPRDFPLHIDAAFAQIEKTQRESGVSRGSRLFRPPGGGLNRAAMRYLYENDITLAWWSNNVGDWQSPPAWKIARGVKATLRAGDVVLLHDGGTGTPQALFSIVEHARKNGLEFVVMPDIERAPKPQK